MILNDKTAIVTGCNRGIGKSILETFAHQGANIIACARNESQDFLELIDSLALSTGNKITPIYFDFSDSDQIKAAVRKIVSLKMDIDIIVNNAGVAAGSLFQMTPLSELEELLKVNFTSQVLFNQGLSRYMSRRKSGSIVNIASVSGIIGDKGTLSYGSSKAAFLYATKAMATELGASNIRVNAIAPGIAKTDMFDQMDEEARTRMIDSSALKRAGEPEEIAKVALFLASDLSSYMTGQVLRVDGGMI